MSAYNTLITDVKCSNCSKLYQAKLQFKFGDTWQYDYRLGDRIKWGGNDIGSPEITKAKVYGILESVECPFCKQQNLNMEFDILIENGFIEKIESLENIANYFGDNSDYKILED